MMEEGNKEGAKSLGGVREWLPEPSGGIGLWSWTGLFVCGNKNG